MMALSQLLLVTNDRYRAAQFQRTIAPYRIEKIALAVAYMREHGNWGMVGGWGDVMGKHR